MYHSIVRRRVRDVFECLNRGDWVSVLEDVADDVHHVFPGDHALGGKRHSRDALARWFGRLFRLFPNPDIEILRVASHGWPWNTWVAVEWIDRVTPRDGSPYVNEGTHWIGVHWGKVTAIHAYLDSRRVADACRYMSANGIREAGAEPIVD